MVLPVLGFFNFLFINPIITTGIVTVIISDVVQSNIVNIFDTDFQETYLLASKAKSIVALRCGMIEMLTTLDKKMDVIYTGYKKRNTPTIEVLSSNSLTKLPNIKANINEYNTDLIQKEELINKIITNIMEEH